MQPSANLGFNYVIFVVLSTVYVNTNRLYIKLSKFRKLPVSGLIFPAAVVTINSQINKRLVKKFYKQYYGTDSYFCGKINSKFL